MTHISLQKNSLQRGLSSIEAITANCSKCFQKERGTTMFDNKNKEEKPFITQQDVMSRGWSRKMVDIFLGKPDKTVVNYYYSGSDIKLFTRDRVESVEKTSEFVERQKQYFKRRDSALKGYRKRLEQTVAFVDSMIEAFYVPRYDIDEVQQEAIEDRRFYYESRGKVFDETGIEYSVDRWTVNFIRHELTSYDYDCRELKGKVGCSDEYYRFKNAVLLKIADVYPELTEACFAQTSRLGFYVY